MAKYWLIAILYLTSINAYYQINTLTDRIDILERYIRNEHMICRQRGEFMPVSMEQASKDVSKEEGQFVIIQGMGAYQTDHYTIFPLATIDINWECFLVRAKK